MLGLHLLHTLFLRSFLLLPALCLLGFALFPILLHCVRLLRRLCGRRRHALTPPVMLGFTLSLHSIHSLLHGFDALVHVRHTFPVVLVHLPAMRLLLFVELLACQRTAAGAIGKVRRHTGRQGRRGAVEIRVRSETRLEKRRRRTVRARRGRRRTGASIGVWCSLRRRGACGRLFRVSGRGQQ